MPRGRDAALRVVENGGGAALMESIRSETRQLDELVQQQMQKSRAIARDSGDDARHSVWLLGVLVIMLLSGTYAVLVADLRERYRLHERLKQSANHDALTGLPNRRFFGEWLGYAIAHARREVRHVGLLFIDVDGLKTVDELHGREVADALLIEIARRSAKRPARATCWRASAPTNSRSPCPTSATRANALRSRNACATRSPTPRGRRWPTRRSARASASPSIPTTPTTRQA
jgi:hypothetical protein